MHIWTIHIVSPVCGSFPFTIDRNSRSVLSWIFDVLIQMIVSPKHDTTLATGHICPPRWGGKLYNNLYQTVSSTWCGKKKCGNKPALFNTKKDGLLGATTSLSIYFLQKYLYNTTMMLPVQPGATLAHMLLVYPASPRVVSAVSPGASWQQRVAPF